MTYTIADDSSHSNHNRNYACTVTINSISHVYMIIQPIFAALTPDDINDFFQEILHKADDLERKCSSLDICTPTIVVRMPY